MAVSSVIDFELILESYVEIEEFHVLAQKAKINTSTLAALVGYIEGIITISDDKRYMKFFEINKRNVLGKYLVQDIVRFVDDNTNIYEHIVNYFNLWHGKTHDYLTYDDFHLQEMMNNIYALKIYLDEDYKLAVEKGDKSIIELCSQARRDISNLLF